MPRVKSGVTKHRRSKQVLQAAKGHRATRHQLYRRAKESVLKALSHAYRHRRERKGDFRRLWILRIGAAARQEGLSYSTFMHGLKQAKVNLNRKMLSEMAVRDPQTFSQLISSVKEQLGP